MSWEEDFIAADHAKIHYPGLIQLQRTQAAQLIQELAGKLESIKSKNGNIDDLLTQLEQVIAEGRRYDPYQKGY